MTIEAKHHRITITFISVNDKFRRSFDGSIGLTQAHQSLLKASTGLIEPLVHAAEFLK
ncbi:MULTISPECIES: hypothetical protein [unclassified Bradyrhizobium]